MKETAAMIQASFEECMERGHAIVSCAPWHDRGFYTSWLAQTWFFVSHSTRLLAFAAGHMSREQDALFRRFLAHLAEEQGHDTLLERDLAALGHQPAAFVELPLTRAFYETQYGLIARENPSVVLGYVLFLEGIASKSGRHVHEAARQVFGDSAVNFVRVHMEEDPGHLDKALEMARQLPPAEIREIEMNLRLSCDLYGRLIRELAHGNRLSPRIEAP